MDDINRDIESLVRTEQYDSYIDATLAVCEKHDLEIFMVSKILSQPIKDRIRIEGESINLLPHTTKLPIYE